MVYTSATLKMADALGPFERCPCRCLPPVAEQSPASGAADPTSRVLAPGSTAENRAESAGPASESGPDSGSRIDAPVRGGGGHPLRVPH